MHLAVDAIYEDGVFKPRSAVALPDKTPVRIQIEEAVEPSRTPLGARLRELRAQILASGEAPLGWEQISEEVASRRGGHQEPR